MGASLEAARGAETVPDYPGVPLRPAWTAFGGCLCAASSLAMQDHLHRNKSESKSKCVKPCPVAQEGVDDAPARI